jgi:hypothetical protein
VSDRLTHPTNLTISTLADLNLKDPGTELADPSGKRRTVIELNSFAQGTERRCANCPTNYLDSVLLAHFVAGMHQKIREFAIVCQQHQTATADIKTADWIEP